MIGPALCTAYCDRCGAEEEYEVGQFDPMSQYHEMILEDLETSGWRYRVTDEDDVELICLDCLEDDPIDMLPEWKEGQKR